MSTMVQQTYIIHIFTIIRIKHMHAAHIHLMAISTLQVNPS